MKSAGLIILAALLLSGCSKKAEEGPGSEPVVPVKTIYLSSGTIDLVISATGRTDAIRKEKVFSPIAGKLLSLNALEGTPVRAGETIALIQTRESQSALSGAMALQRSAQTPAQKAEAERMIRLAGSTQNNIRVSSRVSGIVASRNTSEGELVTENGELATIIDLNSIVFVADVTLRELPHLRPGEPCLVELDALPGQPYRGRVQAIEPRSDTQSQSVRARIVFTDMPPSLKAMLKTEMAGMVRIIRDTHAGVFIVPKQALLRNDEDNSYRVASIDEHSRLRSIPVSIGATNDTTAEIYSDELRAGMPIIIEGHYGLEDSTRIKPIPAEAP